MLLEHAKQSNVGAPGKHADDRPRFGTACALVGARKRPVPAGTVFNGKLHL